MTEKQAAQIQAITKYIETHQQEMLTLWERLVNTESGNMDKSGCDAVATILREELIVSGVAVERVEMPTKGDFLRGVWGTQNPKAPILLCGHMDTVFEPKTTQSRPFRMESGRAYGPGVLDMKAGLVIALFTIRALAAAGYADRPIRVAFPGDEENGHRQSTAADEILRAAQGCAAAFNFETGYPSDGLVVGRKGSCRLGLEVTGVASHAGNNPEAGRNAILEMSHKVIALQQLNDLENGTSLNVGMITGGTAVNAVPDRCHIDVDVRFTQKARLDALLEQARRIADTAFVEGCVSTMTISSSSVVMEDGEAVMALFRHIQATAREIGYGEVTPIKVGGWSDASLIASLGIPVVCGLGATGKHNHAPTEYAFVDSLFSRTRLAAASIIRMECDLFDT